MVEQTVPEIASSGLSGEALATLAGATIGALAAISAGVLTAVVQDRIARRGKVRVVVPSMQRLSPTDEAIVPPEPPRIRFTFTILFFNEKRVDIGIAELALTFAKAGEEDLVYSFIIEKGSPVSAGS